MADTTVQKDQPKSPATSKRNMDEQKYFRMIKRIQKKYNCLKISKIEEAIGINQSTLSNAIKKDQKYFTYAAKLKPICEELELKPIDEEYED